MLDAHQVVPTGALRPPESHALPQDPNVKGRGNQGPPVWMQYMDPSPGTLRQTRTVYHRVFLRIIGAQRKRPDHRMTSYNRALEITRCENIETTLRTRRLLWAGTLMQRRAAAKANLVRKLEVQCREDGMGRKINGPIAYRVTYGRLA